MPLLTPKKLSCAVSCVILCLSVTGCSENYEQDAAIDVTEDFVVEYYVEDSLRGALHNTIGHARSMLEQEKTDIADNAEANLKPNKPRAAYTLLGTQKLQPYQYIVNWEITDPKLQKIDVAIETVKTDEGWKITDFEEHEQNMLQ